MRFAGKDSHVRRLTKAEATAMGIPPSKESYVVTKTYRDPFDDTKHEKGEILSNRQGRNVQTQERIQYRSYSQYNREWSPTTRIRTEEEKERNAWLRRGSKASGRSTNALRTDSEVRASYIQLHNIPKEHRKDNKSPTGPLAQLLVALGLRDEDDTHDVGDTPKGQGNQ